MPKKPTKLVPGFAPLLKNVRELILTAREEEARTVDGRSDSERGAQKNAPPKRGVRLAMLSPAGQIEKGGRAGISISSRQAAPDKKPVWAFAVECKYGMQFLRFEITRTR